MHVHLGLNSVSPPEIRTIVCQTFTDLDSKDPENFPSMEKLEIFRTSVTISGGEIVFKYGLNGYNRVLIGGPFDNDKAHLHS